MKNHLIKSIIASALLATGIITSTTPIVDDTITAKAATPVVKKTHTVKLYNGKTIRVPILETNVYTKNTVVDKAFKQDIKGFLREVAPYDKKSGYVINATYSIKAYKNEVFSVRASFQMEFDGRMANVRTNFNYARHAKSKQHAMLYIEDVMPNQRAVEKYLIKKNKQQWGKGVGFQPGNTFEYYFENSGDVIMTYASDFLGKNDNNTYLTRVPSKYFNYAVLKNR